MNSRLYLDEDASSDPSAAFAAAAAFVDSSQGYEFNEPHLVHAHDLVGNAAAYIAIPATNGERTWLVPITTTDPYMELADWLAATLPGYSAALQEQTARFDAIQAQAMAILADSQTCVAIVSTGILVGSPSWRVSRPELVMVLEALGADAQPKRIRVQAAFEHDVPRNLEAILKMHREALPIAAELAAAGAIGRVDATAYAIMQAGGIDIADVWSALRSRRRVEFHCDKPPGARGWIQWRDFAICADTLEHDRMRVEGRTLYVRHATLPGSVLASYEGGPLGEFMSQELAPPGRIIERAEPILTGSLCITLHPALLLLYEAADGRPTVRPAGIA